jgi:hypothetical protein
MLSCSVELFNEDDRALVVEKEVGKRVVQVRP